MIFQRLDIAEDIVPTATVQANNVVTQGMQYFVHLEYSRQGFNQQRGFDGAARQPETIFGITKDLTPPGRFLPGLGFRQVEIGAAAFCQQIFMVVEEVEGKVEQAAGDRFPIPGHMFFR